MRRIRIAIALAVTLGAGAMLPLAGRAQTPAVVQPKPLRIAYAGPVTDAADILAVGQRVSLAQDLARIEARTRRQIVVATVPTLGGQDIERYAHDLGGRWGVGHKDRDDGIVILLAPNERLVRIAVGDGLDSVLTDAVCQQIIDEVMLPEFREGRLYEGLSGAVAALNARL